MIQYYSIIILLLLSNSLEILNKINPQITTVVGYLQRNQSQSDNIVDALEQFRQYSDVNSYVQIYVVYCLQSPKTQSCDLVKQSQQIRFWLHNKNIVFKGKVTPESLRLMIQMQHSGQMHEQMHSPSKYKLPKNWLTKYKPMTLSSAFFRRQPIKMKTLMNMCFSPKDIITCNNDLRTALSMQVQNITMYKNADLERSDLPLKDPSVWQAFVLTYSFPSLSAVDTNQLVRSRFQDDTETEFVALFCDESHECDHAIPAFYNYHKSREHNVIALKGYFTDKLRQVSMLKIYFHIQPRSLPALVYVSLKDGLLNISQKELSQINAEIIDQFVNHAISKTLPLFYLSENEFENNGFYGKGVEKQIQKLSYNSFYQNVMSQAKHYLVLFTIIGSGCEDCENNYKQYRKVRSYLEDQSDIVFARVQFTKNIINVKEVNRIPQIVLFKIGQKDKPIRLWNRLAFNEIMQFLRTHIQITAEL